MTDEYDNPRDYLSVFFDPESGERRDPDDDEGRCD